MKKLVCILLCLLAMVAVLTGCGGNTTGNIEATGETGGRTTKSLTIGIPASALVLDYNTNAYTLWLEEVSGYDIEIIA